MTRPPRAADTLTQLANATPDSRNRVVDLVRVTALLIVVLGHWVMQGVYVDTHGELQRQGLLSLAPWTHPLTWLLQVMPLIFLVGGYSNAASWRRASETGVSYGAWLGHRVRRLTRPLLPLMVFWAVAAPGAAWVGLGSDWLTVAGRASLVPTWFLATYLVVVACVPLTLWLWKTCGLWSVLAGLAAAALLDLASVVVGQQNVALPNALLVWLTMHQVGYAWLDRRVRGVLAPGLLAAVALSMLVALVTLGPYAVSMVGVRGFGIDNTYPPRVTLVLLGLTQAGITLLIEPPLRAWCARPRVWKLVIAAESRVMTIYLWHLTALGLLAALSLQLGGRGLGSFPDTVDWWVTRPAWFLALGLVTLLLTAVLGRLEVPGRRAYDERRAGWPLLEIAVTAAALAAMASGGVIDSEGRVRWYLPLVPLLAYAATWLRGPGSSSGVSHHLTSPCLGSAGRPGRAQFRLRRSR